MLAFLLLPAAVIGLSIWSQPGPVQTNDTIILLPDENGGVGSVVISGESGEQTLDTAYGTVSTGDSGSLAVGTTSADEVSAQFGELLNATPVAPRSFIVTFNSGSADQLTAESQREVAEVRSYLLTVPAPEIAIIGHTDRVGDALDNDRLSRKRAESVKRFIQSTGIRTTEITVSGRGEREPLIETADGVEEPRNRRVEIQVR
jgi:OmpA-OmpF porin, OOP family